VIFFSFIGKHPQFIESWYSEGLFKFLSFIIRTLTSWIPFPAGEVFLYFLVFFLVFRFVYSIVQLARKQIGLIPFVLKPLITLLSWSSIVYFMFMVLWGLNYHREPLVSFEGVRSKNQDYESQDFERQDLEKQDFEKQDFERQDLEKQDFEKQDYERQDLEKQDLEKQEVSEGNIFSTTELIGLCEILIKQSNDSREQAIKNDNNMNMDDEDIIDQAYSGFHNIYVQNKKLDYRTPSVKKIIFSNLFSYLGVGGIYNPFTGEANVNMDPPDFLLPATVCHEMAHQAGIAPEDEANYVSYIVCKQHPNRFFQYSGILMAMRYAMGTLKSNNRNAYDELLGQISEGVQNDLKENRKYWSRFKNPFEKYSDRIYDQYLKANSQQAGIKSYSRMVKLLLYDYRNGEMSKERKGEWSKRR